MGTLEHSSVSMDTTVVLTLTSLLVGILLQSVAVYDQTWYSIEIKLGNCNSCGHLIVILGEVMENSTFESLSSATDYNNSSVTIDANNATFWERIYNSYSYLRTKREVAEDIVPSDIYVKVNDSMGYDSDVIEDFVIGDSLLVNMGLWGTRVCVSETMRCVQLYPSQALGIFSGMPSLLALQGSLDSCRLLQLLSLTVTFLIFVLLSNYELRSVPHRANAIIVFNSFLAGAFCIASVIFAVTSYAMFIPFDDVIVPRIPWAIIFATISANIQIYTVYVSTENSKQSFQTWRKYYVKYV